jgi:hypothetical protein
MASHKPTPGKRFFTVQEANATLPLVRAIVRDVTALAQELRERNERLSRFLHPEQRSHLSEAHREEVLQAQADFEHARGRMQEYEHELEQLGVELKDYFKGLVDFPAWMNGRPVYLCWCQGEPEVAHWHEVSAGFAGWQPLTVAGRV